MRLVQTTGVVAWLTLAAGCDARLSVMTASVHAKTGTKSCTDPDLSTVPSDVSLTLCNGEIGHGTLVLDCTADGQENCVPDGKAFKAAATLNLVPGHIKADAMVGGVTGAYPSASYPLTDASATSTTTTLTTTAFTTASSSNTDLAWFDAAGTHHSWSGEAHIKPGLILKGVNILGLTGSFDPAFKVSAFSALRGLNRVILSWTRSGGSGVIVVRSTASITWVPTQGVSYAVGFASGTHQVIYKGSAAKTYDTAVTTGTTYYYKVFAYSDDNGYAAAPDQASVAYQTWNGVCGGAGDSCYENVAAMNEGFATTPTNKSLEFVAGAGTFKVWKEVGGDKVLKPTGLDEWAMALNPNGKGHTATAFQAYQSLAGRVCPTNVYIDDTNKFTAGNCLYYTDDPAQLANADGTDGIDGFSSWSPTALWYASNVRVCSQRGMRLPTLYETNITLIPTTIIPTTDGTPTFAVYTGVPSTSSGSWTATSYTNYYTALWTWKGQAPAGKYGHIYSFSVRCVLP